MPRTAGAKVRERSVSKLRKSMENLGVSMAGTSSANFTKTKQRVRSVGPVAKRARMDVDQPEQSIKSRGLTAPPRNEQGVKDVAVSTFT